MPTRLGTEDRRQQRIGTYGTALPDGRDQIPLQLKISDEGGLDRSPCGFLTNARTALEAFLGQAALGSALAGVADGASWAGVLAGIACGGAWLLWGAALTKGVVSRVAGRGGTGLLLGGGSALAGSWILGAWPSLPHVVLGALLGAAVSAWDLERERRRSSPFRRPFPAAPPPPRPKGSPVFGPLGVRP